MLEEVNSSNYNNKVDFKHLTALKMATCRYNNSSNSLRNDNNENDNN